MNQNVFYFDIKTQFENLGDALINSCLMGVSDPYGSLHVCTSSVPSYFIDAIEFPEKTRIYSSKIFFYMHMLSDRRKCKYLLLNPGGEGGELSKVSYVKKNIGLFKLFILKLFGIRLARVGVSYSNLGARYRKYLRRYSRLISLHVVRDSISVEELNVTGIRAVSIAPDLAFYREYNAERVAARCVGYSFRPYKEVDADVLAKKLDSVLPEYSRSGFVQVTSDQEYMKYIENASIFASSTELLTSIEGALQSYSKCEFVISNRLHVLLLAGIAGAIPIAVVSGKENQKIIGVYEGMGLSRLLIPVESLSGNSIAEAAVKVSEITQAFKTQRKKLIDDINRLYSCS